jgi:two-component sensor histidine kinase
VLRKAESEAALPAGSDQSRRAEERPVKRPHARRIRTYLVLFALTLVLPVLLVAGIALDRMADIEKRTIEGRVPQIAKNLVVGVDQELDRALVTLETLATSSELNQGDLRGFHQQAMRALTAKKAAIVLLDRSHQQLIDTLKEYGAPLPPTSDPVTAQRVIDTGKPQISNLFRGSISGRPVFNVEVPVFGSDNQVRYVLVMSFQAAHFSDLLEQFRLSPGWIAGITDNNGVVLARSERRDDFVGKPLPGQLFELTKAGGVYKAVNLEGQPILRATERSQRSGWYISTTVPLTYVEAPRLRGLTFGGLLLGTALTLSWGFAYIFARLMARPLDEATRAARAVGHGDIVEAKPTTLTEANVLLATLADASRELSSRAEHADYLMRELAHRAKNQLAVIAGMALQTSRQSNTVAEFIEQFDRRIQGLSQSQDLLLRQNWRGAWMDDLVYAHLDLFGARERVTIEGPRIFLGAAAVQNIGFALNELATNAMKYGALSAPAGKVEVHWSIGEQGGATISWQERGGTAGGGTIGQGFGHRVITQLVPRAIDGSAILEFASDGVRWSMQFAAKNIVSAERAGEP